MSRFFFAVKVEESKAWFDDHEYRHFQVMRVEEGETIVFTDGRGALFSGVISFARDRTTARITNKISQTHIPPSQRLAVGIAHAQWDREEVLIEKGTELGVTDFYLFPGRYSKYRDINLDKVKYTLRKAIKQSENPHLPLCEKFERLEDLLSRAGEFSSPRNGEFSSPGNEEFPQKIILHPGIVRGIEGSGALPASPVDLFETRRQPKPVMILVGPEGGFHPEEVQSCVRAGFTACTIGRRTLRLETAALCGFVWASLSG